MESMNIMFEELVDSLDREFPKGVRDRGKALVLFAEAIIYAHQWAKREHKRGVEVGMAMRLQSPQHQTLGSSAALKSKE